ncbi:hypothetical protein EXIGLDRAFT_124975 [Exidia glandulosa HHB12029]|uniref:F-box domain-containing protein n=1 Tax=Exidia glandulosa HHB12029 TaxID=1314781 RepID=A0A165GBZ1_EXIGL|nr:hypothetical protein EXIGLDRAFT_124975 [Exidia glandulosa HHB12029]
MDTRAVDVPTALSLMETSHLFRETVLPLVTSSVRLAAVKPMRSLIAHVDEQPSMAKQIRTIVQRPTEQAQTSRSVLSVYLSLIFLQCFDAEQLSTLKLNPVDDPDHGPFRDMPRNLTELDAAGVESVPNVLATSQDFARLDSLRTLRWSGEREFTVTAHWPKKLRDKRLKAPSKVMPALRELDIGSCHDTFFSAMEELELPSLETLKIHQMVKEFYSGKMLLKHGPKLHTLEIAHGWKPVYLTLCPRLQVLVLHTTPPSGEQYLLPDKEAHPILSEIRLHWYPSHNPNSSVCVDFERLVEFLAHRKKKLFPQLATIRIMHERLWPVKERDLESPWLRYAQSLKQYGMHLLDGRGEQWKSA